MAKIKISEKFFSLQGEGRYMGVPSVFLRTYGCNFSCAGFGMPAGQRSTEADDVAANVSQFSNYGELPLVSTGCDSYPSWHVGFKHLSPMMTTDEIAQSIVELLPHRAWKDEHLVITGGEPLLGWQRSYPELLSHPLMANLQELTFETNGTQHLSSDLTNFLSSYLPHDRITFSVSAKLSCSGESREEAIRPDIICEYERVGYTYLKFVIATEADAQEAVDTAMEYRLNGFHGPVYLMPVGGVESVYTLNNRRVAELALKHGMRYSDRLQIPLFKNQWAT